MGRPKKKEIADLEWYVYRYSINKKAIKPFNIFNHYGLSTYMEKWRRKYKTKEEFMEKVKSELLYYFWAKAEHELVIELIENGRVFLIPWFGCRNPEEVKIEVINELEINWHDFAEEYINRQIFKNRAKIDIYDQVMWRWDEFCEYVCRELGVK